MPSRRNYQVFETLEHRLLMAVLPVLNNSTSGAGSLRDVIASAAAGDSIDLRNLSGTINFPAFSDMLQVSEDLTLLGPGADVLTLDAKGTGCILMVSAGSHVTVSGLTLANAGNHSAIYDDGTLTLDHVTLTGNHANATEGGSAIAIGNGSLSASDCQFISNTSGGIGSAIATVGGTTHGQVDLNRCNFINNSAKYGGALYLTQLSAVQISNCMFTSNTVTDDGGATFFDDNAAVTITNSTFSFNTVAGGLSDTNGGAILLGSGSATNTFSLLNCTIYDNGVMATTGHLGRGGGLYSSGFQGSISLINTVLAFNGATNAGGDILNLGTGPVTGHHNFIGMVQVANNVPLVNGVDHNIIGMNGFSFAPALFDLADNGGNTLTCAMQAVSSLRNAGDPATAPATDQRGMPRDATPDIGAFEYQNQAPAFSLQPDEALVFDVGSTESHTVGTGDADGDARTITATNLPPWLTFVDNGDGTATFTGTPQKTDTPWPQQYGDFFVTLRVSDGTSFTERLVNMQASETNYAPVFTSDPIRGETAGVAYSYAVRVTDANDDPLTLSAPTLPWWLTFTDNGDGTGTLAGTRPTTGSGGVTIRASDGITFWDQTFTITVTANHAPTFTGASDPNAYGGAPFTYTVYTADLEGNPVTLTALTNPAWLTFKDNGDGTATLSGTPSNDDAGADHLTLRVSDGALYSDVDLSILVTAVTHPPTFDGTPLPSTADALLPFTFTIGADDIDGDTLSFNMQTDAPWLGYHVNDDHSITLSGTPQTTDMGSTASVTITVNDNLGPVNKSFQLAVPAWRYRLDANGTLAVVGGSSADIISIAPRSPDQLRVTYNGTTKNFPLASIKAIEVYGQDGDDTISLDTAGVSTYALGGAGNDTLIGGDQVDNLVGGGGKDRLEGNAGDDRLSGLAGNDYILGGGGKDRLYGGDGNDVLNGGTGADRLWGDAGFDVLLARDKYRDLLYAEPADLMGDTAQVDAVDTLNGFFAPYV